MGYGLTKIFCNKSLSVFKKLLKPTITADSVIKMIHPHLMYMYGLPVLLLQEACVGQIETLGLKYVQTSWEPGNKAL